MDLNTIWFALVAVLISGYAVLDGFDLGVGVLHLFARNEDERLAHLRAIGPVWDGNEVWLLTGGGALFAAFPVVYATVFSGFYLALILLLVALILRAVSVEFRNQLDLARWHRSFDVTFAVGSLLPALLFGVAVGNVLRGLPIDEQGNFTGTFLGLLNPYALLVGVLSLVFFVMHGAIYLSMKVEGDHRERMRRWAGRLWIAFVLVYLGSTAATLTVSTHLFESVVTNPLFWVLLAALVVAVVAIPRALRADRTRAAFAASSVAIVAMIGLAGVSMYPRLVSSLTDLDYSLTVYNAASSKLTMTAMLIIALIGMPVVILYTTFIHRVFRGKVRAEPHGY